MNTVTDCTPRKVVLKRLVSDSEAHELVDAKKAAAFRTMLSSPKKDQIHTHSVNTAYEATTMLLGEYRANYYRKAEHTINVDHNVKRVEIGDGVFNVLPKSRIGRAVSSSKSKRKVTLHLEEYVSDFREGEIFVDHHGSEVKRFAHPKPSKLEPYPSRVLDGADIVRHSELKEDALVGHLCEKLVPVSARGELRDLQDRATIKKIVHIYIPIIEAKLVGPKKRIRMLRIDAVSKKVLKA